MHRRDTSDVRDSAVAVAADAVAVAAGFLLAVWIRFDSGWLPVPLGRLPDLYRHYAPGLLAGTLAFLLVFRRLGLYVRPQLGRFEDKIPRIVRGCFLGLVGTMVLAFMFKNFVDFSTVAMLIALPVIIMLTVFERYLLFRVELHNARHSDTIYRVLVLGTGPVAAHLRRALERDPKRRSRVVGFLKTDDTPADPSIPPGLIGGRSEDLAAWIASHGPVDQVVLTGSSLAHDRIVELILFCERELITFNLVPDLFRILTGSMEMQAVDDIPLLGVGQWPLDWFWARFAKRIEDLAGGLLGLLLAAPVIALSALLIKATSRGPVFYRQTRCGERGRPFDMIKLRTMRTDAEAVTGPVWTTENDPRVTPVGRWLRRLNLDELPQFWNVVRGDMSLVGPRPERPHFVEKFKGDIGRYMSRHVVKPGLTGWAQVNGLRGNTSVEERIKYDLYYLENWSLAFDFKILLKTLTARKNAY